MNGNDELDEAIARGRVTNMHLAVAIKNTRVDVNDIKKELIPLKKENAENTVFRQKAYGIIIGVGTIWTAFISFILWAVDKVWGKN